MSDTFEMPALFDAHVHLRQPEDLPDLVPWTANCCAYALVMPNTEPPITTADRALVYRDQIGAAAREHSLPGGFRPLMTLYLTPQTTTAHIREAAALGIKTVKFYPCGATTASNHGIPEKDFSGTRLASYLVDALVTMEYEQMVLSVHGELPSAPVLEREDAFVGCSLFQRLPERFPGLKIALEHLSGHWAIDWVRCWHARGYPVAGTITRHHLVLTREDWIGKNHNLCRPLAGTHADRKALALATKDACFFFGSDSAPHPRQRKECAESAYGCFTAPGLDTALVDYFDKSDTTDLAVLPDFACRRACAFYGVPVPTDTLRFRRGQSLVPPVHAARVPFRSGQALDWIRD